MTRSAFALGHEARTCRMCGDSHLEPYLDLGHMPPADRFLTADQLKQPEVSFPLEVCLCRGCGLSQLGFVVDPAFLYQEDYPYEASTTQAGRRHFAAFASSVTRRLELSDRDLVVDVGSNVGVLLKGFADCGTRILGVDPASNIAAIANERGIPTVNDFFDSAVARQIVEDVGQATVITGTNVFAHIDELSGFIAAVSILLDDRGVFIFEAPYFVNLLRSLEYDTIYHEHLSYISFRPLVAFFERFGYRVFDVEEVDIHGGSCRVFVDRGHREQNQEAIAELFEREDHEGAHDIERLNKFATKVAEHRRALRSQIFDLKREGKRIAAVSAPAKGMTLTNFCGLGPDVLDFVTEKTPLKIGRFTPGLHIPVVPDERLLQELPDFAVLLAWNFAEEIMNNLAEYRDRGGKFIVPIPSPHIVT